MKNLYEKACKIGRLYTYMESANIPKDDDLEVALAAKHQLWCATSGDSGRWEDATPKEIAQLRRFVNTHCRKLIAESGW